MKNIFLLIIELCTTINSFFAQQHKKEMKMQGTPGLPIAMIKGNKVLFSMWELDDYLAIVLLTNLTGTETSVMTDTISKYYFKD